MTRAARLRAEAGFTLLELLVAVLVLGMVSLLLSQGLDFGLRAQSQQSALRGRTGDVEAVDLALRRLITAADPGQYPEPAKLQGQAHAMALTTELPLHGAGQASRADVSLSAEAGQLVLRWRPHRHVEASTPKPPFESLVLLEGVQQIELGYLAANGVWRDDWAADKLPQLIRLRLVFSAQSGRHWPPILAAPRREAPES